MDSSREKMPTSAGRGRERSLAGKTILITGSTSGVGKATARELARRGARVVLVGRDRARGEAALAEIRASAGHPDAELLLADLSSLAAIRGLAREVAERYPRLDVLVNNVGGLYPTRWETVDGIEATFAVNVLGPFLLTYLTLPLLKASAPARIVNLNSNAHRFGKIHVDDLQARTWYRGMDAYCQAKLINVLLAYEWARRLAGTGVTVNVADPGGADTAMTRTATAAMSTTMSWTWRILWLGLHLVRQFRPPEEAARSTVYAAASPELDGITGQYVAPRLRLVKSASASYDVETGQRLWEVCAGLAGVAASGGTGE